MAENVFKRGILGGLAMILTLGLLLLVSPSQKVAASVSMNPAYDLSEWQHQFTDSQVQSLKNEASFVILRAQYGSAYHDKTFQHNLDLIKKYNVPYGVYSYSMYDSASDAKGEAKSLYSLAPDAGFYVNDIEENNVTSGSLNDATNSWAQQMRLLTNRPIILYSGLNFMTQNIGAAKSSYDALWLAAYSSYEPNPSYHYDLWQYTDHKYSAALGQSVDASVIPTGGKPLSFWTGSTTINNNDSSDSSSSSSSSNNGSSSSSDSSSTSSSSSSSTQPSTINVVKPRINPNYYSSKKIKKLLVINDGGVNLYRTSGSKVRHYEQGDVIKIQGFRKRGNITQAIVKGNRHVTSNKDYVSKY